MTIDIAINILMQSIENPTLTLILKTITNILDPITIIATSTIISMYLYLKNSNKKSFFLMGTIIITGLMIKLFKEIFQRARPLNALITETSFSNPSGHATIAVVFFGLIVYLFTNKKKIPITIATITILLSGFIRIYLRVHWLTDVLLGFLLGGIILIISILIYENFNQYYFFSNKHPSVEKG